MEDYTNNNDDSGVEEISLQNFSYRDIREKNPLLKRISKREYMNNSDLQEYIQGERLDGSSWLDDFEFDNDLTIGQEFNILSNKVNEPQPIDDSYNKENYDYNNFTNQFALGGLVDDQEYPKNKKQATRNDSLRVYNSAINFKNKIKKLNYKEVSSESFDKKKPGVYMNEDGRVKINYKDKDLLEHLKKTTNKRKNGDIYLNSDTNLQGDAKIPRPEDFKYKKDGRTYSGVGYNVPLLKKINDNQYQTIEQAASLGYNTKLPSILMDGRIDPQKKTKYDLEETDINNGDFVQFNEYDPLAVKPFDLLSESEKKQRVKKYGYSGVPKSYLNKKELSENKTQIKSNPKLDPFNLNMADLVRDSGKIESDAKVIPYRPYPKSFKVTETEVNPYGLDDRKEGNNVTTYEVENIDNISSRKLNGKREIKAQYANGGFIDPPVRTYGLSSEQKQEVEDDALFVNNWNANREVNGVKLENGYQIPSSQKVGLKSMRKGIDGMERMAEFDPNTNSIGLNKDSYETGRGFPAHEYSHRFQKYTKRLNPETYNDYILDPITSVVENNNNYYTDPEEIHSELMRLRRNYNFNPTQTINNEDVSDDFNDEYNFNNINKDDLIKLLNSTAYNDYQQSKNIASHGGKFSSNNSERLVSFEGGGTHEENSLGGIPIGMGRNDKENTVEHGETRYGFDDGDYIFSNRINTKGLFRDFK